MRRAPGSTLFPYTTLFRSMELIGAVPRGGECADGSSAGSREAAIVRSEEHTSELQSHSDLVCRLLLEKKKHHAAGAAREEGCTDHPARAADRLDDGAVRHP